MKTVIHFHPGSSFVLCSFVGLLLSLWINTVEAAKPVASHVSVTILATNVGDRHTHENSVATTQGEWNFAVWVEVDGRAFLFDTGWLSRNVLHNVAVLGIDLSVGITIDILARNLGSPDRPWWRRDGGFL